MNTSTKAHYIEILNGIEKEGLIKKERIITTPQSAHISVTTGQQVLNMCANNYLGLADNPEIIKAAKESFDKWGFGMSSVRFICGTQEIHKELENLRISWNRRYNSLHFLL
jgi:glycine C-acetyltransferase